MHLFKVKNMWEEEAIEIKRRRDNNEPPMTPEELMKYKDVKLVFLDKNEDGKTFE